MIETTQGRLNDPYYAAWFSDVESGILDRIICLASTINQEVNIGFHLCYGDMGHVHFVQPEDTRVLVNLANSIIENVSPVHAVKYIHMPAPKERQDKAYFAPLANLHLGDTKLYLGLLHPNDHLGTKARIEAANEVLAGNFGVASECGLGRTPKNDFDSIIEITKLVI
jgi:hypothetical protein